MNKQTNEWMNECPNAVVAEWILDNIETDNKCKNITTQVCPKKFGPQTHGFPTKTKTPTIYYPISWIYSRIIYGVPHFETCLV